MPKLSKVYTQNVDATRFIGKKYVNADRVDGHFGAKWNEWHTNGWFDLIKNQFCGNLTDALEDGGSFIGLMKEDGDFSTFEYWIGIFMPANTPVPNGFAYIDFPASTLGVCWIYGKENEVFGHEGFCGEKLKNEGYDVNVKWCFERYACPRFTTPDEYGNIIIDICFFLK